MPSHHFHAPFVHWEAVPRHNQIKSILLPKIHAYNEQYGKRDLGNALTTFFSSFEDNVSVVDKELTTEIIWNQFDKMLDEMKPYPVITKSCIKHIWYNVYQPGDYATAHSHTNADFCGMYLLDCPDTNNTLFHPHIPSTSYPFNIGSYSTPHIKEGDILFWPSHLMHSATPCTSERTVLVFNIISDYTLYTGDCE